MFIEKLTTTVLFRSLIFFELLAFLLSDVAITWYCFIYHYRLVDHHGIRLISQQLIGLFMKVPQDFDLAFLNHHRRFCQLGSLIHFWTFSAYPAQMFLYTKPATWFWCVKYTIPPCILHLGAMCCTVSGASLHNLNPWSVWCGRPQPLSISCLRPVLVLPW